MVIVFCRLFGSAAPVFCQKKHGVSSPEYKKSCPCNLLGQEKISCGATRLDAFRALSAHTFICRSFLTGKSCPVSRTRNDSFPFALGRPIRRSVFCRAPSTRSSLEENAERLLPLRHRFNLPYTTEKRKCQARNPNLRRQILSVRSVSCVKVDLPRQRFAVQEHFHQL